jgi:hypothetical protein
MRICSTGAAFAFRHTSQVAVVVDGHVGKSGDLSTVRNSAHFELAASSDAVSVDIP